MRNASEAVAYSRAAFTRLSRMGCNSSNGSGSRSTRTTCWRLVCDIPARMRVLMGVMWPFTRSIPLVETFLSRNCSSRRLPASSSPTTPTGRTLTPSEARFIRALAPPPGTTTRSRCLRMSTGASRDTRAISPKTNSSAIRSTRAVMETSENDWTAFFQRSASFKCLVMNSNEGPAPGIELPDPAEPTIVSCGRLLSLDNCGQHRIDGGIGIFQMYSHGNHVYRLQGLQMCAEVHGVFFRGEE